MKINNLETLIDTLSNIPGVKRINKTKFFHDSSNTTIKINTSKKILASNNNTLCKITTDYGIAGTRVNDATVLKGIDADALINYINQIIKDSWWNN